MTELETVQTQEKLNKNFKIDDYLYIVTDEKQVPLATIQFQKGPRKDDKSISGVLDCDLLEIVKDRLEGFMKGQLPSPYTERALKHVKFALYEMNERVEDRIKREVLGTYEQ